MKIELGKTNGIGLLLAAIAALGNAAFGATIVTAPPVTQTRVVVYVAENTEIIKGEHSIAERVVIPELQRRGYRIVPADNVPGMAMLCPNDVFSVWNSDKWGYFRRHFATADILWMAQVDYLFDPAPDVPIDGTIQVRAAAFDVRTGWPVWKAQLPKPYPLRGPELVAAARAALGAAMPPFVEDFEKEIKPVALTPSIGPAQSPRLTGTPPHPLVATPPLPLTPLPSGATPAPYTGVVIEAEHLSNVLPSYRTQIGSQQGGALEIPKSTGMSWTFRSDTIPKQAGAHPLRIRALGFDRQRNRLILPESEFRKLQQYQQILNRPPVIYICPPPAPPRPR